MSNVLTDWWYESVKELEEDPDLMLYRQLWDDKIQGEPMFPFNYTDYDGMDGYKALIRKHLTEKQGIEFDSENNVITK